VTADDRRAVLAHVVTWVASFLLTIAMAGVSFVPLKGML
jgi:hypothetical protein